MTSLKNPRIDLVDSLKKQNKFSKNVKFLEIWPMIDESNFSRGCIDSCLFFRVYLLCNHFKYLLTSMHGCVRQSFWLAQIFTAFFFKADKDQKCQVSKQRTKTMKLRDSTKNTVSSSHRLYTLLNYQWKPVYWIRKRGAYYKEQLLWFPRYKLSIGS